MTIASLGVQEMSPGDIMCMEECSAYTSSMISVHGLCVDKVPSQGVLLSLEIYRGNSLRDILQIS